MKNLEIKTGYDKIIMNQSLIPTAAQTLHNIAPIFLMMALGIELCLTCVLSRPILNECLRDVENQRLRHGTTNSRPGMPMSRSITTISNEI